MEKLLKKKNCESHKQCTGPTGNTTTTQKLTLEKINFANLFYYSAYFFYYLWVLLYFLILFIGFTVLFQLIFTFIYSTFTKNFQF